MKKFMFAAMAALAITGCSQSEEFENDAQKVVVNFNTIVGKATLSRATPMVTANFTEFKVYAYNAGEFDGTGALGTPFMNDVTVKKNPGWVVEGGPYYWPIGDKKNQFFAYSPATNVQGYAIGNPTGFPSFTYTIQDAQEDLLAAQVVDAARSAQAVSLTFAHILTQINFSAALEAGFTYTVSDIKITGVHNTGKYSYAATAGWTTTSGDAGYTYAGEFSATVTDNLVSFSTGTNALLLMPQALSTNAKISVTYKATSTNGQETFNGTKSVALTDAIWGVGKNIRYKLTLPSGAQAISFDPKVGDWDTETNTPQNPS